MEKKLPADSTSLIKSVESAYILVVEDNKMAQLAVKMLLTSLSCRVDIACDGQQALELSASHDYDLILMDIGLGEGLDGYEVTQHLRQRIALKDTPIIALTACVADNNQQRCMNAGMNAVLSKPLTRAHAIDLLAVFGPQKT